RMSPQEIENDVARMVMRFACERFYQCLIRLLERNHGIGPKIAQCGENFLVASSSYDVPGSKMSGDLDGEFTRNAGCSKDVDGFSRLKLCAKDQRQPGSHGGVRQSRSGEIVNLIRNGKTPGAWDNGALGHHAIWRSTSATVCPRSIFQQ